MAKSPETLNQRFKRLRIEWGFSQAEWAKAAGVATSQVGRWETTGKGEPSIEGLRGLAALKGMTVSALIGDEQPKFAAPRKPTPEEIACFFLDGVDVEPKRKAIAKLALTAVPEVLETMYVGCEPFFAPGEGVTTNHKKPSAG